VIWFNDQEPHAAIRSDDRPAIPGCTSTGKEVAEKLGQPLPNYNPARAATLDGVRRRGIVEKCTLCDHRVDQGLQPWCVDSCPTGARIFGDLDDPESAPRKALARHASRVLQPEQGTKPNVYYIRDF
jgi:molybdopterin-containing oxidoreductase family iron-sulfur binding subunit